MWNWWFFSAWNKPSGVLLLLLVTCRTCCWACCLVGNSHQVLKTSSVLHQIFAFIKLQKKNFRHSGQISTQLILHHNYRMYCPTKAHSVLPCCCGCVTDRGMYCLCVHVCVRCGSAAQSLPGSFPPFFPANSPPLLAWVPLTSCTLLKVEMEPATSVFQAN